MTNTKKILCSVLIIIVSLILLIPFFYTLMLSFSDYNVIRGLFGSSFVGFKNISLFLSSPYFSKLLSNTFIISSMGTIIGAIYVFLSSLSIGSVKNKVAKAVLTATFALPSIIPVNLLLNIFPTEILMNPSFYLRLCVSFVDGLRVAGLITLISFFISGNIFKKSLKCVLVFVGIRLLLLFSPDLTIINGIYNPLTYEILDVIPTYTYRTGLMNGSFSQAAAAHIVKTILQILPAFLASFIFIIINKNDTENNLHANRGFTPLLISIIIPLSIFTAVIIKSSSLLPVLKNEMVITGFLNEFLIAFVSALLVAAFSLGLAALARNCAGFSGIIALVLLCITGNSITGKYVFSRSLGLANTFPGVVFYNFSMISLLSVIMLFATYNTTSLKKHLSVFIGGFILMFAHFWGDFGSSVIMLKDRNYYPLSLILREILMQQNPQNPGIFLSTLPYILIPVITVLTGFIIISIISSREVTNK